MASSRRVSVDGLDSPETLRQYALLADGERGAVIGPHGNIEWLCFPGWGDDAIFSSLLGGGGLYAITPAEPHVWGGYYEPGTLIWRSRWVAHTGIAECREALSFTSSPDRLQLVRTLMSHDGAHPFRVRLDLRPEYGRRHVENWRRNDQGLWECSWSGNHVRWVGAGDARPVESGRVLELELTVTPGHEREFVLEISRQRLPEEAPNASLIWERTEDAWRREVPWVENSAAPRDTTHAVAVLRGLTAETGGMVAAATTSLPERARSGRNFDYRYVWMRDACYAGTAVATAGGFPLMDRYLRFIRERLLEHGPRLKAAYTVDGKRVPEKRQLHHLSGYPGGNLVFVGNEPARGFQLDVFGEALVFFAEAAKHDRLDADGWRAAEVAAEAIAKRWRDPDEGVWELGRKHWTHSRLICAAGLRQLARCTGPIGSASKWTALADAIVAETSATALQGNGLWKREPDDPRLDASLLTPGYRGALPPDDPRIRATLEAVQRELCEDGYVYRYRVDHRPLGRAEGAFLLCGFWLAMAHLHQGNEQLAYRWFERNRAACGPPGLFTEEFDVQQRELRSNLPQAFVHALMLECSVRLVKKSGGF